MEEMEKMGFATKAIHGGNGHDSLTGALSTPIYQTSAFVFRDADHGAALFSGKEEGFIYTRLGNPTQQVLERKVALLEKGEAALATASGMAATLTAVLVLASQGESIVSSDTVYGGTYALFHRILPNMGIQVIDVDASDLGSTRSAIRKDTKAVFIETPANPTMKVIDIEGTAQIAKEAGIPLIVDNTFPTPYLQSPLELGADIVIHSATKYIGGHGDTIAGLIVGTEEFIAKSREVLTDTGACISPFNAWLLIRGLKTLALRMERHSSNAMEIARFLESQAKIAKVMYPGLPSHPQHKVAKKQMREFGGMIALELKGGKEAGKSLMNSVKVCVLTISLGDIETLIEHPASMTHSTYSREELEKVGITPGLVRLSVGLEDVKDLIKDLDQALAKV